MMWKPGPVVILAWFLVWLSCSLLLFTHLVLDLPEKSVGVMVGIGSVLASLALGFGLGRTIGSDGGPKRKNADTRR